MFVALQPTSGARVISIDSCWNSRLEELRLMARRGDLVCPGCQQPLWYRSAAKGRRRHFAHRQQTECPLSRQSMEVMEAKAQLFEWLSTKYPGKVNLEIACPGYEQPVDLMVEPEPGRKFIYWVFDSAVRHREHFLNSGPDRATTHAHFIHAQGMLNLKSEKELLLTASQRDFIGLSKFDEAASSFGGHLHFIDTTSSMIRIYRGLWCAHPPNVYRWEELREGHLSEAKISPKTGEIVMPEDASAYAKWKTWKETRAKPKENVRNVGKAKDSFFIQNDPISYDEEDWENDAPDHEASESVQFANSADSEEPESGEDELSYLTRKFRCEDCGTETTAWSSADPSTGTCVCNTCAIKRHEKKKITN